jgi:hypothetical protein
MSDRRNDRQATAPHSRGELIALLEDALACAHREDRTVWFLLKLAIKALTTGEIPENYDPSRR